jgi:hypothetical protein
MGGELRLYDVTLGGHKTRMQLDDAGAADLGANAVLVADGQDAPAVRPAEPTPPAPPEGKNRLVTSNKMRGTNNPSAAGS